MRMRFIVSLYTLFILVPQVHGKEISLDDAVRAAVRTVAPSIVRIETTGGTDTASGGLKTMGPTTGVVVAADGWIISSAYNLAHKPAGIVVTLPTPNGEPRRFAAKVVATDHSRKLTLLHIDATDLLVPVPAPKEGMKPGQHAIAAGRTWDLEKPSIALGIISALGRIWGKAIQTDAKVSPVNYGGPLVNLEGQVLGIIVPMSPDGTRSDAGVEWYDSGIGFAIPFEDVLAVLPKLKAGDIHPGIVGIRFANENALFEPPTIARVAWSSPAEAADLKTGDTIKAIDGKPVTRIADVRSILGSHYAEDSIELSIDREGQTTSKTVELIATLPAYHRPFLGIIPDPAGPEAGCTIEEVHAGSPAATADLCSGDRIVALDDTVITSPKDLEAAIDRRKPGTAITLKRIRAGMEELIAVTFAEFPSEPPPGFLQPKETVRDSSETLTWRQSKLPGASWEYSLLAADGSKKSGLLLLFAPKAGSSPDKLTQKWSNSLAANNLALVLLEPSLPGAWQSADIERASMIVKGVLRELDADATRIVAMGIDDSATAAEAFRATYPEMVRGLALVGDGSLSPAGPAEPATKVSYLLISNPRDNRARAFAGGASRLRELQYPVTSLLTAASSAVEIEAPLLFEIGRWTRWLSTL